MPQNRISSVDSWIQPVAQSSGFAGFAVVPAVLVVQAAQPLAWQLELYRQAREQAQAAVAPRASVGLKLFSVMN